MHGARSKRVLSTGNHCTSPGETTASAEDRRQPTAAAAAGRREPTQKNPTKIAKAEVFAKSEVKVWECRNCGHIVVGEKAPEVCPACNHPQSYFEIHAENY